MPAITPAHAALAALTLAACGAAGAATLARGSPLARAADPALCTLAIRETGAGVEIEGRLTATTRLSGSYDLRIARAGASGSAQMTQGGTFTAEPGQEIALGSVGLSGRARDLDAALTVEIGVRRLTCPAT
ncbi:MAG: hypothetical protein IT542_04755 [Rubellimicrobium sp.]|nr:hypothetical protein [Rubellimicrobium sp.]